MLEVDDKHAQALAIPACAAAVVGIGPVARPENFQLREFRVDALHLFEDLIRVLLLDLLLILAAEPEFQELIREVR